MEPQDNLKLALQKAIHSHEQAVAGLTDLEDHLSPDVRATMLARLTENIKELHARVDAAAPEDRT
ncbi:hypothetical protein BH23GEM8_BH23GEM8_15200 [soil metagenome]